MLPHLERLRVWVPEKHDLALMKAMRAYEHALQAIVEIHAHSPLDRTQAAQGSVVTEPTARPPGASRPTARIDDFMTIPRSRPG